MLASGEGRAREMAVLKEVPDELVGREHEPIAQTFPWGW